MELKSTIFEMKNIPVRVQQQISGGRKICELEDISKEIIQSEELRVKEIEEK